jgi:outer membrane lipopolysaccharide assembly protein LptE/RlpB
VEQFRIHDLRFTIKTAVVRAKSVLIPILAGCILVFLPSCKVNYSFTGASIAPDVKTFAVKYFTKTAALGPASLNQTFTEKLKDKFVSQTNLAHTDKTADLTFEGSITNYAIAPIAIQTNEVAAQNRLTITVSMQFTNLKDEKQNFETSFSRYSDYPSNQNITEVEDNLIKEISDQIIDDIFNKAVINW